MREIKFRAWSKGLQKYFYNISPLPFGFIASHPILAQPGLEAPTLVMQGIEEETVIQQYTGLKDKNGKEIYEGDIVRETCQDYPTGHFEQVWKVKDLMEFCHRLDPVVGFGRNELEIIGNIYENPELIK